MREDAQSHGLTAGLEERIPFPGLPRVAEPDRRADPRRASACSACCSPRATATGRFGYDEEDGFMVLASHVGAVAALLEEEPAAPAGEERAARPGRPSLRAAAPLRVRRYAENDSIFVGEDYLIKGVAGAILWRLLRSPRRGRPHRAHQPRAAPRPGDPPARPEREPRGAPDPARSDGSRSAARPAHREDGPRTLPVPRPAARRAGRDPALSRALSAPRPAVWSTCGTNTKYGVVDLAARGDVGGRRDPRSRRGCGCRRRSP